MSHEISLAVWDLRSPIVVGRRATLKAGVACPSGCDLTGTRIEVYDDCGAHVGGGEAGAAPWPGTTALHWAELEIRAPEIEHEYECRIQAIARDALHGQATSTVRLVSSRPPEHHVTLEVIDKGSGVPVAGVALRLGRFRATTDEAGIAHVDVPGGTYDVCAWKIGYDLLSIPADITNHTTVRLALAAAARAEQPYWM